MYVIKKLETSEKGKDNPASLMPHTDCSMASSPDSSTVSKKSYDSESNFLNRFQISDEDKTRCLEDLQSNTTSNSNTDGNFSTCTSCWIRSKQNSAAACTLFKVKRWHLLEDNYIFDPFKKCKNRAVLTPKNTLWCTFANEVEEVSQSALSVDAILSVKSGGHSDYFHALQQFDEMLAPLDISATAKEVSFLDCAKISSALHNSKSMALHRSHQEAYAKLTIKVIRILKFICDRKPVPENEIMNLFEDIFAVFKPSFQPPRMMISCDRSIGLSVKPVTMPIKLKDQSDRSLVITSEPELFLYANNLEVTTFSDTKTRMIAVIKEKQATHVNINNSSEGLPSLTEEDEDDEDDITPIERLEKLIESPPPHLVSIKELPIDVQIAVKRFLPQLIGEMWVISRCDQVQSFQSDNGLLFGIGIVGFEVYFITTLDTTRKNSGFVINDDSAYTDVVVSGPFNLLMREDRRKIFKVLVAAFVAAEYDLF